MDFAAAITAHSIWKRKLSEYLAKRDRSLKPAQVEIDNQCELGKWIHGEGKKHSKLKEYSTLQTEHARFHVAAADLVRRANEGESVTDLMAFGAGSDFTKASSAVIFAIKAIQARVSE